MAIQMRRGNAVDFDPSKMVPGEWAISQDNQKVYVCFNTGSVVEIASIINGHGYIRYSENADGTDFVAIPTADTKYIGFYMGTAVSAPTDKLDYVWSKYVGDKGDTGDDGEDGNKWYRGTNISGKSSTPTSFSNSEVADANPNDFYINVTEGAVYHCVTGGVPAVATWSYDFTMTGGGGGGGTSNYSDLINKPQINSVELTGNKTSSDLGLASATDIVQSDWSQSDNTAKDFIKNKPTVPQVDQTYSSSSTNAQSGTAVASAISGKADAADLDEWHTNTGSTEGKVQSNSTVTFNSLNDSYGYELYCDDKVIGYTAVTKSGSGTNVSLTFTVTGAASGDTCHLRVIK